MRVRFAGLTVRPKMRLWVSGHYEEQGHVSASDPGSIRQENTMSVCGTFVMTNGTAPQAYKTFVRTASSSAYLPTHEV